MNPTQAQLDARLNPTPFNVTTPTNTGFFKDPGGFGANIYKLDPSTGQLQSFDLLSNLLSSSERTSFGSGGAQGAEAIKRLQSQYGIDYNSLATQNIGDLYSQFGRTGRATQNADGMITNFSSAGNFADLARPAPALTTQSTTLNNTPNTLTAAPNGNTSQPTPFSISDPSRIINETTGQMASGGTYRNPNAGFFSSGGGGNPIANPINTSSVLSGNTGAPTLPTPQAGNTMATNTASLTIQVEQQKVAVQAEADKRAKEYQTQINDLKKEKAEFQTQMDAGLAGMNAQTQETLMRKEEALTLEKQRFDENYNANQALIGEMSDLLTTGNQLVEQMKGTTGLASIMNPRIAKTMSDVQARVGVIQAVLSARNGQMTYAQQQLSTNFDALSSIHTDHINYYKTVVGFYDSQKTDASNLILSLSKEQRDFLDVKLNTLNSDLSRLQNTRTVLEKAMMDPDTASKYATAGVTMNDSVEQIGQKLATYAYSQELKDTSNKLATGGYSSTPIPGVTPTIITDSQGNQKAWYKRGALTEVSAGSSLIDPNTGKVVVTAPKEGGGDIGVGRSSFRDIMQLAIDTGATPELAAREAALASESSGIPVDQKTLSQWITEARGIKKTVVPPVAPVVPVVSKTAKETGQATSDFLQNNPYYRTLDPANLLQGGKDVASGAGNFFSGLFGM